MKHIITLIGILQIVAFSASADSKVVLTREFVPVETTIPGEFNSLESIIPALFTLADQASDKSAEQVYLGGKKTYKDLIFYYRGVRIEDGDVIVSFSKGAQPYFSGSASFDATIMKSLTGTIMLYEPNAKKIKLEIDGKVWENNDG